ncbi:ATP-grasp domain-containing protein [Hymenobacter sp. H14-R3]|uniref:ATP-grasp domain-containing protein n=1 Tax=Hymenobacter sp. H14-R3 TaxID=3046308 RepID=UPI0024B98653|nr:ATP-grasp domain-containing protein [Hymenobacter sp. H14-R3]MDJ0366489.1 ATP-grasp domain-containing protein [Hymenobacter sp. H14-R3]
MIKRAYIHEYGSNKVEPEHKGVMEVLEARGIRYEVFTAKRILRNQLVVDEDTFVVGDNAVIIPVLKKLGFICSNDSYPKSLEKYYGRHIWVTTIRDLVSQNSFKDVSGIFVKPKSKTKLFTGFVIKSEYDLFQLSVFSKNTDLYCSALVRWLSEYRVFVNNSEIVGVKLYAGNESLKLDMAVVEQAITEFEDSADRVSAYGIDFGVLDTGQTTLVEWNDGFALGSYGLDKEVYTDLLLTRWEEILQIAAINKNSTASKAC